jgi:hypothetical protein
MRMTMSSWAPGPRQWPRWLGLALGLWLLVSTSVWPYAGATGANTWLVGMLVTVFSLWGLVAAPCRGLTALLALWLYVSTVALWPGDAASLLNNALTAVLVLAVSCVPSGHALPRRRERRGCQAA